MNIRDLEASAEELLNKCRVIKPHVDVDAIAEKLKIVVKRGPMKNNISGAIYREDDHAVVAINSTDTIERQRFTLAHECAHYILHKKDDLLVEVLFRVAGRLTDPKERAANAFAAALLMPEFLLTKEPAASLRNVKTLAAKYKVSEIAMSYRLVNLGLVSPS